MAYVRLKRSIVEDRYYYICDPRGSCIMMDTHSNRAGRSMEQVCLDAQDRLINRERRIFGLL